ncbi:hypothetical protein U9M48_032889 [Paspalum notatum var. saurae]|uniref:HMA domain-containing protein n=1 Tax=Paspalum notatum var. saurae TaxID=547442 RepID=A0AAQ3X5T6_PASNO
MTKTKIVIKVSMPCERCRSTAMAVAARADGVISMEVTGDKLEVVGDGVDAACLAICLRRKLKRHAEILLVEDVMNVKAKQPKQVTTTTTEKPAPKSSAPVLQPPPPGGYGYPCCYYYCHSQPPAPPPLAICHCEEEGPGSCTIM